MKTKTPQVNPNPKPFSEWILRPSNGWKGCWLFSEDGTTGYWEFAVIAGYKNQTEKRPMEEIRQEAKEIYEMFYGKPKNKKIN